MARHRSSHNLSQNSKQEEIRLAQKDAWNGLVVWLFLEVLSFAILPRSNIIPGNNKLLTWLTVSVPLGLVGAYLIGLSSWLMKHIQEEVDRSHPNKRLMLFASQLVGWVGLLGIGLPSIMVGLVLWSYLTKGG